MNMQTEPHWGGSPRVAVQVLTLTAHCNDEAKALARLARLIDAGAKENGGDVTAGVEAILGAANLSEHVGVEMYASTNPYALVPEPPGW